MLSVKCSKESYIKFVAIFFTGVVTALIIAFIILVLKFPTRCESGGIKITATNDTSLPIDRFEFRTSSEQTFTCTLKNNSCDFILVNAGDMSIKVNAITSDNEVYTGEIGYAESCSSHSLIVSSLVKQT